MHQQQHCHLICKHSAILTGKDIGGSVAFRFQLGCEDWQYKKNLLILRKCDLKAVYKDTPTPIFIVIVYIKLQSAVNKIEPQKIIS